MNNMCLIMSIYIFVGLLFYFLIFIEDVLIDSFFEEDD